MLSAFCHYCRLLSTASFAVAKKPQDCDDHIGVGNQLFAVSGPARWPALDGSQSEVGWDTRHRPCRTCLYKDGPHTILGLFITRRQAKKGGQNKRKRPSALSCFWGVRHQIISLTLNSMSLLDLEYLRYILLAHANDRYFSLQVEYDINQ